MLKRSCIALLSYLCLSPALGYADDPFVEGVLRDIRVAEIQDPPETNKISTADGNLSSFGYTGKYITNEAGRALYMCESDTEGRSTCTGDCATVWPPLAQSTFTAPQAINGAKSTHVGIPFARTDGANQCSYNKYPVYTYKEDLAVGDTKGHCVNGNGCRWHLLTPDGIPIGCEAGGTADPGSTGGGCGAGCSGGGSCNYSCKSGGSGGQNCYSDSCGWGYCNNCYDSGCGDHWVCGWDAGYECLNNHNRRGECCKYTGNSGCHGSGTCDDWTCAYNSYYGKYCKYSSKCNKWGDCNTCGGGGGGGGGDGCRRDQTPVKGWDYGYCCYPHSPWGNPGCCWRGFNC